MDVRQLEYFVALARERHFSRAAASCDVTQATLSNAISRLEDDLQAPLVHRGRRFEELTTAGERVLAWAERIVSDCRALRDDIRDRRIDVTGSITLGVVPSALPPAALLADALTERFPNVRAIVRSASADDIALGLTSGAYHAGVTYLTTPHVTHDLTIPLYHERYALITAADEIRADRMNVDWRDVTALPLCLPAPHLQFRRQIDAQFARAGVGVHPRVEVDSFDAVLSHVVLGGLSSVLPHAMTALVSRHPAVQVVPLDNSAAPASIGVVAARRAALTPAVTALVAIAARLDMTSTC